MAASARQAERVLAGLVATLSMALATTPAPAAPSYMTTTLCGPGGVVHIPIPGDRRDDAPQSPCHAAGCAPVCGRDRQNGRRPA